MGIEYTREKMGQLVSTLAAGIDPLPERLEGVYIPLSGAIHDAERLGYLPSDLLKRMQAVMARLTYVEGGDEGHLAATLKAMTPYEASEIASELVELAYMVGPEEP